MYVSMSRLRVPAERADGLVRAFRARVGLVDRADSTLPIFTASSCTSRGTRSDHVWSRK